MKTLLKNRGTSSNPEGRFESLTRDVFYDDWYEEDETLPLLQTEYIEEKSKSIIARNDSPDLGFEQSINPYQGCEHGCVYCYARPTHGYKNLSSGLDFESKIFYKTNAAELLEKELSKKNYQCKPIVLGANTDPYQPIESKLKITRQILQVLNAYNHPAIIITKGAMIERDSDILQEMAQRNLIKIRISITSNLNSLKRILEPRASSPQSRFNVLKKLNELNIPTGILVAPIIPFINDMELEKIMAKAQQNGAKHAGFVLIRLPHEVKDLFKEWLTTHFPQRAAHVMSIIKDMRGGKEYDATFGVRMRGVGEYANLLALRFELACKKFQLNQEPSVKLDVTQFKHQSKDPYQLSLW
jgi:DNA repair photolyase